MTRKLFTTLLCLMLAIALPLTALADTRHTLTLISGDGIAAMPALADLCDTLSITLTRGEKSGGLTFTIGGEDIATVAAGADSTGLYVQSTLLGDDVYYITWDDGFAYASNLIMELAEKKGVKLDETMASAIKSMLDVNKIRIVAALGAMSYARSFTVTGDLDAVLNDRDAFMEIIRKLFPEDLEIAGIYERIFDNMTLEEGRFTDPERDTATRHLSIAMTSEDMASICNTKYMRSITEMILKFQYPQMEEETLSNVASLMIGQARSIYEQSEFNFVCNVYTGDEDTTLVGMDMGMEMTMQAGDEKIKASFNFNYDRLTGNNGVDHRADMSLIAGGKTLGLMDFKLTQGRDGVSDGHFATLVNQRQLTFAYHAENQGNERMRTLKVYRRGDAAAIIAPAASDRPFFGFQLVSGPADDSLLDAVGSANADTAIDVMKLSAEEMQSLFNSLKAHAIQKLFTVMGKMPDSVIMLLLNKLPLLWTRR